MPRFSERALFRAIGFLAIAASLIGVARAWWIGDPLEGGRGGAIAVALALTALFATRNYAAEVYDALTSPAQDLQSRILKLTKGRLAEAPKLATPEQKMKALEARLKLEAEGQRMQNFWLALSTAVGTIFWGFGDLFAASIIAALR